MGSRDHLRLAGGSANGASEGGSGHDRAEPSAIHDLLLARARRGDAQAWARLYQDHYEALHRHLTYLVGDPSLAEDLVQEVFARAVVGIAGYDERAGLLGWLRGIAANVARLHWRSSSRRRSAYDRFEQAVEDGPRPSSAASPDERHLQARRAEALLAALETLPANLREAFVAVDLQQRDPDEAAAELGVTVNNLRVRASRARARVREVLRREGWITDEQESPR